ncbi:MAG TPA: metal-dependent hydrolase [Nevskiales bacterium]|nr:metal-dependent hydrolase [Nevskiales bacterium]
MDTPATAPASPHPMPVRRDLRFGLPAGRITDWNAHGPHLTQFMNTLSLYFPVGERFFMDSVRHYRERITDPELKKAVTGFIGQEAMHGREHQEYNEALFAAVPATAGMERFVGRFLKWIQTWLPARMQLSATIALEHFTAIMADGLLKEPRILEGAEPKFAALWRWHALEETEHKAVAFDVWTTVMGRGPRAWFERCLGLLLATVILWTIFTTHYLYILGQQGLLTNGRGWGALFRVLWGEIGFMRKLILPWADYFRPGFHPWDHDNRHFLAEMDKVTAGLPSAPSA